MKTWVSEGTTGIAVTPPAPPEERWAAVRPLVVVTPVALTVARGELQVLLSAREEAEAVLPRCRPAPGESLEAAALRELRHRTGRLGGFVEQLYTQSGALEEGAEPVLDVAYLILTRRESQSGSELEGFWRAVSSLPPLAEEDRLLLERARRRLRERTSDPEMPAALLPPEFALSDLQQVHEAVLSRELDKRNFRKWVLASGSVEATSRFRRDGAHRPARLYCFRSTINSEADRH